MSMLATGRFCLLCLLVVCTMAMAGQSQAKRSRVSEDFSMSIASLASSCLPVSTVLEKASRASGSGSVRTARRHVFQHRCAVARTETPLGPIMQSIEILSDKPLRIHFAHPSCLLYQLSKESVFFGSFLMRALAGERAQVVIYSDEAMPGNQKRPDDGRKFLAVYWTICQFPDFFRVRSLCGWLPFCYLQMSDIEDSGCSLSHISRMILKVFWTGPLCMSSTGFPMLVDGATRYLQAEFCGFLADERGEKYTLSVKGATGTHPCACCKNVLRIVGKVVEDTYFVDVKDMSPDKFDLHTVATFTEAVTKVEALELAGRSSARLQQLLGLTYDPQGILWDPEVRQLAQAPDCILWDWQHCLVASGGMGQYELHGFIYHVVALGLTLEDLDEFATTVCLPRSWPRLPKKFFRSRCSLKKGTHIRAFAQEVITAAHVLGLLADTVIKPMGKMESQCDCLDKFRHVLGLLQTGDAVMARIDILEKAINDHCAAFKNTYPEWHVGHVAPHQVQGDTDPTLHFRFPIMGSFGPMIVWGP